MVQSPAGRIGGQSDHRAGEAVTARKLLLAVWGRQSCQNPDHWPDVLARLLKDGGSGENKRTSFEPRVEAAIVALTEAYSTGIPPDGADLVWCAFPMLDRAHCRELATLLATETPTAKAAAA